jgi:hypothetical protein
MNAVAVTGQKNYLTSEKAGAVVFGGVAQAGSES